MIVWRPRAWQSLETQAIWLAENAGAEVAERLVAAVELSIARVASQPALGRVWEKPPPSLTGLRWLPIHGFRNHLLFYRPIRRGIEVVHVMHGARDVAAVLGELE